MSPARAEATARSVAPAPARRPARPRPTPVPDVETPRRGLGRITHVARGLREGNQLGRIATLATIALFASVFGVVVFQTLIVQGQARLDNVAARTAVEEQRAKDLRHQVADLESPNRISQAATALGMIRPGVVGYQQPTAADDAKATYVPTPTPTTAPKPPTKTTTKPTTKTTTGTSGKTTATTTPTKKTTTTTTPGKTTTTTVPKGTKP